MSLSSEVDTSWARYCPRCAARMTSPQVATPNHKKCPACSFILYFNPKVAAGTIPREEGKIWLIKRNNTPALGRWTFPGGYVDAGERVPDAAIRETLEETLLQVSLTELLNVYSYPRREVVVVVYLATVEGGRAGTTAESQEVRAFSPGEIPWDELAFPSTRDALREYLERSGGEESGAHVS